MIASPAARAVIFDFYGTLTVGTSMVELSGARANGMRAIQIRGREFATAHTYDAETTWDGEIITDLRELFAVLDIEAQGSNAKIPAQPQRVRSAGEP
ncbi:MAG: hypothetical protein ACRDV3_07510 [Acidothermaceae bacterium]